jgi:pimeloyl-ACP methyl ester carboxylesterase
LLVQLITVETPTLAIGCELSNWGARAAYIGSCIAPQRVTRCVALSVGWGTNDPNQKLSLRQLQNYWYHWYMALDPGAELVRNNRVDFTRYIWGVWNPNWTISDEEFLATAASFQNPDWAISRSEKQRHRSVKRS